MPKIVQCDKLFFRTIEDFKKITTQIRKENHLLFKNTDNITECGLYKIELEKRALLAKEVLFIIEGWLNSIANVFMIPKTLSPAILILKYAYSQVIGFLPEQAKKLGSLSAYLSCIIFDACVLSEAVIDFKRANITAVGIIDEVKLIAHSTINELYPNLDSAKAKTV